MAKPFGIIFGSPLHWVELDARTAKFVFFVAYDPVSKAVRDTANRKADLQSHVLAWMDVILGEWELRIADHHTRDDVRTETILIGFSDGDDVVRFLRKWH
jgi:hypothetical protein